MKNAWTEPTQFRNHSGYFPNRRYEISCHVNNMKPEVTPTQMILPPGWTYCSRSFSRHGKHDVINATLHFGVEQLPTEKEKETVRISLVRSGTIIE